MLVPRGRSLLKKCCLKILLLLTSNINFVPCSVLGIVINAGNTVQLCIESIIQDDGALYQVGAYILEVGDRECTETIHYTSHSLSSDDMCYEKKNTK